MADEQTTKCLSCDGQVPKGDKHCSRCGFERFDFTPCVICKQAVPKGAERCNKCSAYQGHIRRHFVASSSVLALLTAFVSVLTFALPRIAEFMNRNSNTVVTFISADEEALYIRARNTGLRPSTLRGYRLRFGDDLPIEMAELSLLRTRAPESRDYVPKEADLTLSLTSAGLRSALSRGELEAKLAGKQVTLEVDVQESNGPRPALRTTISADQIRDFILAKVPEV